MSVKRISSTRLRFLTCCASLLYAATGGSAWAQSQEPSPKPSDQDAIVVTAQKKPELLLNAPLPISVVSAKTLTDQNLVRLSDFYNRIPGIQYTGDRVTNIAIRGITSGGVTTSTVAIVIDDIPLGASTIAGQPTIPDFDPATLERIEVLRGPQGTLYGASSLGGLIRYVTREPDTHKFSGRVEGGANFIDGGSGGKSFRGSVNIPIIENRAALSVSGFYRDDPRWIDNIRPGAAGKNVNRREGWGGRAALKIDATDNLKVTFAAIRQKTDTNYSTLSTSGAIPICPECVGPNIGMVATYTPKYNDLKTISVTPSTGEQKYQVYSARAEWNLNWATASSTTAWSRSDNLLSNDVTQNFSFLFQIYGAPSDASINIKAHDYTRKFSQELRLAENGKVFDWLLGAFYTSEHSSTEQILTLSSPSATPLNSGGPTAYREVAVFANATYHVTPKWNVQGGARYSKNKLESRNENVIDGPAQAIFGPSSSGQNPSLKDHAFTWLLSSDYHVSDNIMTYARVSTGYRPGGTNNDGFGPLTYGSDTVTNYELGLKGYVVPRVLSLDVSVFQIDWKNIQLQNTDVNSGIGYFTNGSKARSRGVEIASQAKPWGGMVIDANAAFTDAKLTQDLPILTGSTGLLGKAGDRLPFSAKFSTSISARQSFSLGGSTKAFVGATLAHVGDRQTAFQSSAGARPRFTLPSYSIVDLQAGISMDEVWHLSGYIRNLFNENAVINAGNGNGVLSPTAVFAQPRTFGFTVARDF